MKIAGRIAPVGLLGLVFFAAPKVGSAQAPPGPITVDQSQVHPSGAPVAQPPTPKLTPRTNILGAWKLDPDDSDDARKKMQDARSSSNGGGFGGRRMGGMGGGYPGGGRGGYGGGQSDDEKLKMQELLTPASGVTLSMTGAEVDLTDNQGRKRAFLTDGRKLQKSKDENYQEIAAKWDGNRLVTEEKNPSGGKMSRTFELSYDGLQLDETLNMKVGRGDTPVSIRYVYDLVPSSTETPKISPQVPPTAKQ
jgi:hypothetical protein